MRNRLPAIIPAIKDKLMTHLTEFENFAVSRCTPSYVLVPLLSVHRFPCFLLVITPLRLKHDTAKRHDQKS